ncbi:hypothetical protein [Carnobacterium iners]|uniref:hypothetical protein n=1 Tax=Carnobacterium iners TaxID=1073423 RepID=UPI0008C3D734|nr:hypothetical protein [Carnobacterium iners]SEK93916.1 (S)-ureidoglycine-glyoxylate aminotransferase [Carnobacterium iners]
MTPGPVEISPRVLRPMSMPISGQYAPVFRDIMDDVSELLKNVFRTKNITIFSINGTARSGIEAAMLGLVEEGDWVLIPAFGRFSYLLVEFAKRAGVNVRCSKKTGEKRLNPAK